MKQAYFATYIYFDKNIYEDSFLIVNEKGKVEKIIEKKNININELEKYSVKEFHNSAIFPALINTHTHHGMGFFRGIFDDLSLMEWLNNYIWPAEKKMLSPEFIYYSTLLSIAESIHGGVSTFNEMYFYPLDTLRVVSKASVRAVIGLGVMESIDKAKKIAAQIKQSDKVKVSLAPHALYTVNEETMRASIELAGSNGYNFHTHLAETLSEEEIVREKYNRTPVEVLNDWGAFELKHSTFAHCVHLSESDIAIMGEKGVSVAHCLESNLKLASGFSPIAKLFEKGANITIGTDSVASNNDLSLIAEMSTVSKVHKALNMDPTCLSAQTVLQFATENAAKALGFDNIGCLKEGNQADFFVLSLDSTHLTPIYHPISHLIYAAKDSDVTDLYIDGKVIMENRKILTFDEEEIKEYARKIVVDIKSLYN